MHVQVGRVDAVFVLACSEERLRQKLLQRDPHESRPDDTTLAIENRLKIFKTETLPLVEHFGSKGLLTVVRFLFDFFHFSRYIAFIVNFCVLESYSLF